LRLLAVELDEHVSALDAIAQVVPQCGDPACHLRTDDDVLSGAQRADNVHGAPDVTHLCRFDPHLPCGLLASGRGVAVVRAGHGGRESDKHDDTGKQRQTPFGGSYVTSLLLRATFLGIRQNIGNHSRLTASAARIHRHWSAPRRSALCAIGSSYSCLTGVARRPSWLLCWRRADRLRHPIMASEQGPLLAELSTACPRLGSQAPTSPCQAQ